MSEEHLTLKWGTLKGWKTREVSPARHALVRYSEFGMSVSAMGQRDGPEQKQALCDLIDAIDGPITNDWTGETLTKDEAKKYIMEYGK